ncbi:DUF3152 domain-containing protein [Actinacidiphila bryophytorum]|uniref:DUF3152 domain-containing protein n=1 Tax=Actinacidiphila bryophytorum TaxID=1436133 RepID=A0A9W4E6Q4_9ACTN|nr:DUF3152 domain-containing protein [Actinacidiphila bryophytorum]CAG7604314.1 conserved hypothetical protein [Actinacidiphila bryophytorum]
MGKHSARDGQDGRDNRVPQTGGTFAPPGSALGTPGSGRRRRSPSGPYTEPFDPFDDSGAFAAVRPQDLAARPPAHPEHREHGAWGTPGTWTGAGSGTRGLPFDPVEDWAEGWAAHDTATAAAASGLRAPRPPLDMSGRAVPRPRQEFLDAFEQPPARPEPQAAAPPPDEPAEPEPAAAPGGRRKPGKATWTISGIAAAAVVTVVAVAAGGQLTGRDRDTPSPDPTSDTPTRSSDDAEPGSAGQRTTPGATPSATVAPVDYDQLMDLQYPLDPDLKLSGAFDTVPGHQAAPGKGKVMTFRVDVEQGLPLDAQLFSDTVFKTLNDSRSWGHGGTMTFERVSTGHADIVVTLASPGTTAKWCARSGLDTTIENVSCDAASTPRTMINAYRWAQGADTYGPRLMHAYRQMLINHEVGHRLGHGHVGCPRAGAPAPVMMQQTKFLSLNGGPTCRPNAWPFP